MKKHLSFISLLSLFLLGITLNVGAQREVIIEGYAGTGDILPFINAIGIALDADAANRDTDPNVTYILKRNQIYPNTTTIKNTYNLRMKAEDGAGAIPVILTWEDSEGKYKRILEASGDVVLAWMLLWRASAAASQLDKLLDGNVMSMR